MNAMPYDIHSAEVTNPCRIAEEIGWALRYWLSCFRWFSPSTEDHGRGMPERHALGVMSLAQRVQCSPRERKDGECIMRSVGGRIGRDERGTNTVGLALILVLLLALVAGVTDFGRALGGVGGHRVGDAENVAAQQQQALRRSLAASRGARPGPTYSQLRSQQRTQLAIAAQNRSGVPAPPVRGRIASVPARWGRQFGVFLFETLPEGLWELVRVSWQRVRRILQ